MSFIEKLNSGYYDMNGVSLPDIPRKDSNDLVQKMRSYLQSEKPYNEERNARNMQFRKDMELHFHMDTQSEEKRNILFSFASEGDNRNEIVERYSKLCSLLA